MVRKESEFSITDDVLIHAFISYVTSSGSISTRTVSTRQLSRYIYCRDYDSRFCDPPHSLLMKVQAFLKKLHEVGILRRLVYKRGRRVKYVLSQEFAELVKKDRAMAKSLLRRIVSSGKDCRSYV